MKVIIQPYGDKLGKLLAEDLNSDQFSQFMFSVAYAKISGVDALYDSLQSFVSRGGTVCAAIGIDKKNTSYEALRAVRAFASELYIFHNRSMASTFHPKVYIMIGDRIGKVYIGSNNLTNGGLYSNYEVASCEAYDLSDPPAAEAFANVVRAVGSFFHEGPCCKKASEELIQSLYDTHQVCTESEIGAVNRRRMAAGNGTEGSGIFGVEPITGSGRKHDFSYLSPSIPVRDSYRAPAAAEDSEQTDITAENTEDGGALRSFYKRLSGNDVDKKSSPGQIIIPIAFKNFFEPLSEPKKTQVGAMQSERYFNLLYENNGTVVENARIIFYEPAPEHKRKNSELRFALRNRDIFGTFGQNDVLVFTQAPQSQQEAYGYTVKRIAQDDPGIGSYPQKFAWIQE